MRRRPRTVLRGSILYDLDVHADWRRRLNKRPSPPYDEARAFYVDLQARRLRQSGVKNTGFYAILFRRKSPDDDDDDDDDHRRVLFGSRESRMRRMQLRARANTSRVVLVSWRDFVARSKRSKDLLARHVLGLERRFYYCWRWFARVERRVRRALERVHGRNMRTHFETWSDFRACRAFLRQILRSWRQAKVDASKQRVQVASFMSRSSMLRNFEAWHTIVRHEIDARRFAKRRIRRTLSSCFQSWLDYLGLMRHVQAAASQFLGSCLSAHFDAWARFAALAGRARRYLSRIQGRQLQRIFAAFHDQARLDRLDRLGLMDPSRSSAVLSAFYAVLLPDVCQAAVAPLRVFATTTVEPRGY
ncbi:hypothetical protein CTAYLR_001848 [Chrysophaeum taylorii]|uniref:Sfi1 spindle body domain-containing protein n=1 Tax=Chrysophaeum taylorii TaxID=2483200 RepID=A0AAD7U8U5_9STRA|nr:hypothetical protein CTAYLR_001848 [Chrysophaeum taylorii]